MTMFFGSALAMLVGLLLWGMVLVMLVGCATPRHGFSGSVMVTLGGTPPDCAGYPSKKVGGCYARIGEFVWIWCPANDAACLAHEIRHALGWRHE